MNVIILKPTRWNGESLPVGSEVTVDLSAGQRWIRNGIAQAGDESQVQTILEDQNTGEVGDITPPADQGDTIPPENPDDDAIPPANPYEGMKAKELYDLCKEKGIDAEARKTEDYYIELLQISALVDKDTE